MLLKLINLSWIFILLYTGYAVYERYELTEQTKIANELELPGIQKQILEKQRKKKRIEEFVKDIEHAKNQIELVAQQVESIQKKLPEEVSNTEVLELLNKISKEIKLQEVYLSRGEEENKGFYFVKKFRVKAKGTYLQLILFFDQLANQEMLLNISNLNLERTGDDQKGRFQLLNLDTVVEAFKYNSGYVEDRGLNKIDEELKKQ